MFHAIKEWISGYGISAVYSEYITNFIFILIFIFIGFISNFFSKKIIMRILEYFIKKTKTEWDDILLRNNVFSRLPHIIPAMIIHELSRTLPHHDIIQRVVIAYLFFIGIFVIEALIDSFSDIYRTFPFSKNKPIKAYLQVIKIFLAIIGTIIIIGTLINRSPWKLLSGIGAMTAILLLVFKDSILGLVASIQLSAYDMVKLGDWIEMPSHKADGSVIDITLNTVKIQNWDKTISTVPTYALVSDSFKNWKGMSASGGRRMKRHVYIDVTSVSICSEKQISEFENIDLIKEYILAKKQEVSEYNTKRKIDISNGINGRQLTNLGTFRAYVFNYLKNHQYINQDMTLLVRQLQPGEFGIPLEIYAFISDKVWANYESIQADIFDHLYAVLPKFKLKAFQNPTGEDFKKLL